MIDLDSDTRANSLKFMKMIINFGDGPAPQCTCVCWGHAERHGCAKAPLHADKQKLVVRVVIGLTADGSKREIKFLLNGVTTVWAIATPVSGGGYGGSPHRMGAHDDSLLKHIVSVLDTDGAGFVFDFHCHAQDDVVLLMACLAAYRASTASAYDTGMAQGGGLSARLVNLAAAILPPLFKSVHPINTHADLQSGLLQQFYLGLLDDGELTTAERSEEDPGERIEIARTYCGT
jgi:hypothetical protein